MVRFRIESKCMDCLKDSGAMPESIPQRPAGYFAVTETPAEYARANYLAALSPSKPE
jgi:hypothetical protein